MRCVQRVVFVLELRIMLPVLIHAPGNQKIPVSDMCSLFVMISWSWMEMAS